MSQHPPSNISRWKKYDLGSIKCNVDASIFTEAWEFDMGACVRNSNGAFMKWQIQMIG